MKRDGPSSLAPSVVHVSPRVQARGGIETLHTWHRQLPGKQVFVALFDRGAATRPGYVNLDCTWRTPLAEMRRRFARALAPYAERLVIYHNGWGLPLLQDLDQAHRRAVMLHADPAYHAPDLAGLSTLIDGALVITPAVQSAVIAALPELAGGRANHYRVPIELPPTVTARAARPQLTLGYAGRIERVQKRLDRLPEFLRAMRATGMEFRFELIGDGAYRTKLEQALTSQAHFHGWVSRPEYWRIMASWDAVVFFSDHEGGPIALLEGMAAGALPFYPARGGSWGDVYAPRVDLRCHYPPGDMPALARAIQEIFQRPAGQLRNMRERSRALVQAHRPEQYLADCSEFTARTCAAARISRSPHRGLHLSDVLPLGLVTRLAPGLLNRA